MIGLEHLKINFRSNPWDFNLITELVTEVLELWSEICGLSTKILKFSTEMLELSTEINGI